MNRARAEQRGDTIIEVMLVMAIVGLVLGSSFGIANRSVRIGQSATERTQALKISETQLELMKSMQHTDDFKNQANAFCIDPDSVTTIIDLGIGEGVEPLDPLCAIEFGGGSIPYHSIILPPSASGLDSYSITTSWVRLGSATNDDPSSGIDSLTLYYKTGVL